MGRIFRIVNSKYRFCLVYVPVRLLFSSFLERLFVFVGVLKPVYDVIFLERWNNTDTTEYIVIKQEESILVMS